MCGTITLCTMGMNLLMTCATGFSGVLAQNITMLFATFNQFTKSMFGLISGSSGVSTAGYVGF